MNLHRFIPPIHIHPVLIIFIIISFMTGTFIELIIILAIVLFHELGHFMMATYFKWRIRSVMLWIFGGVMDTDEHGNKPLFQDILVTIAGPLQHIVLFILILLSSSLNILSPSVMELVLYYNTILLVFNLLPIWPLDGGKLLSAILSLFLPFKKAYDIVILFSIAAALACILVQLFLIPFNLSVLCIMLFLMVENKTEWKQRFYVFIRFLLKRYEGNPSIRNIEPIIVPSQATMMDVFERFKRDKSHSIYIIYPSSIRKSIDENECLHNYFYERHYYKSIGEVADLHT